MLLSIRPRLQRMSEQKANLKLKVGAFNPPDWPRRAQGAVPYDPLGYGTAALGASRTALLCYSTALPLCDGSSSSQSLLIPVLVSSQLETESTLTQGAGSTGPCHTSLSAACPAGAMSITQVKVKRLIRPQ